MIMTDKYKHSSKARMPKSKKDIRLSFGVKAATISRYKEKRNGKNSEVNLRGDWIYGIHPVMAALANQKRTCLRIIVSYTANSKLEKDLEIVCKKTKSMPDRERMDREQVSSLLPPGAVHQGLALLASPLKSVSVEEIIKETKGNEDASLIVLDQATDPRNIGAVMRSAAAFGASAVILQDRHAPPLSGALCKAASGAVEWVALIRVVNLARSISSLKIAGFWAAGLDAGAGRTLAQADLSGRVLLVLGAEGAGLRRLTRDTCDELLKVSVKEKSDSLNLSNAATVALYELNRQRD